VYKLFSGITKIKRDTFEKCGGLKNIVVVEEICFEKRKTRAHNNNAKTIANEPKQPAVGPSFHSH
jgi:hypothetical protein